MKKSLLSICFVLLISVASAQTVVTFYTSMGRFAAEIYDNKVPITGGNFLNLADSTFYDGVIFHRVIDGFMVQTGDPTGTGSGGPGYTIQDEFDPTLSNIQKTLSMANTGQPNSGGSQFFINLVNNTYLDYDKAPLSSKHAVFGMVIENFTVVQDIGQVATNSADRPLTDVVIDSIRRGNGVYASIGQFEDVSKKVRVYPNPTNEHVWIEGLENEQVLIQFIDPFGKIAMHLQRRNDGMIDVTSLKPGIYVLRLSGNSGVSHTRIVIE